MSHSQASQQQQESGPTWSVSETLSGKTLLLTGATGFLGKAFLSMLLRYHPDIEQVYVLIRPRTDRSAQERFFQQIAANSVMDPLRDIYEEGYLDFIKERCTPLAGDITEEHLGLDEEEARAVSSRLDVLVNSAGLTNFNPNLESALTINTLSQRHMLDFLKLADEPAAYMHVSTCFVTGNDDGKVPEALPGPTRYPNHDDLGVDYDASREIDDCLAMIAHAKLLADDQEHQSLFTSRARQRLAEDNRAVDDPVLLEEEIERERSRWLRKRLSKEGRERADFWGWPNIYTYTKSLGERVLADARDEIDLTIFRPAIVESAYKYPERGWNEGINTSAPLVFLISKGHRFVPTRRGVYLDVVPVDFVAGSMIAATAALIEGRHHPVYQCGSSDRNPVTVSRLVELTNLGLRRLYKRTSSPLIKKALVNALDGVPVSAETFERQSAPAFNKVASGLKGLLDRVPSRKLGALGKAVDSVKGGLATAEALTEVTGKIFELMIPFTHHNAYEFVSDNITELVADLPAPERQRYGSPMEEIDWREYWMDIHVPGLARHAFPELEAKFKARPQPPRTYDDLIELLEASASNFEDRIALQHHHGGITESYTYAELDAYAERAAEALGSCGVRENAPVLLVSENRPQWGMSYFGILKADGVAVPVDPDSTVDELVNLVESSRAVAVVLSDEVDASQGDELRGRLEKAGIPAAIVTHGQIFRRRLAEEEADQVIEVGELAADGGEPRAPRPIVEAADEGEPLASLIYTSGTTGEPKGVMLTHENFTSLLSSLQQTFDIDQRDGFLSVLPLHHTFEFACGFLMPLSEGATITYLEELNSEELNSALRSTRVTSLIGVPALWQLLHRRIAQRIDQAPPAAQWAFEVLSQLNATLRDRFNVNLGPTAFRAVHEAFGGQLRYLISGGAALPGEVLEAFHGLGFNLYEGYGLTEAAPVLTVNRPDDGLTPGSVGTALPGVEVDIADPDDDGIGEVIARGPNVMRGYLGREEETDQVLDEDGWLRTGDLGRFDRDGNLEIVGRKKEVIVTSGGKNVYPDELEEVYSTCDEIAELSIVGLPDGSGSEKVACLVRPEVPEGASPEQVAEVRQRIREFFRIEGSRLASHRRVGVLRFWDQEFPRTATRKIKRREVVEILERLLQERQIEERQVEETPQDSEWAWLHHQIAQLAEVDPEMVRPNTHFADELGFDSLMVAELSSILAERDFHVSPDRLGQIYTVGQLQRFLDRKADPEADPEADNIARVTKRPTHERVDELTVPPTIAEATKNLLRLGQKKAYDELYDVKVYGRAHIPRHNPNIIVAANHASHLDMGLVKYALGDYGKEIRALAASDYFFSNPLRKTYFKHFTNLLPVERSGNLEGALAPASEALERGEMLLLFPEGTRSKDGSLQEFRHGLGYLVAHQKVDVLPMYLSGTHRALPKGKALPSPTARTLAVHIGPVLEARDLLGECEDLSNLERYEYISQETRDKIVELRDATQRDTRGDDRDLSPLFDELNDRFEPDRLDDQISFYFSLGHNADLKWTVIVGADDCHIRTGKPDGGRADCVIKTSPDMFEKIVTESYVPSMDEFMSGEIKTNDPNLLRQFQQIFAL